MQREELEVILKAAFLECERSRCPLNEQQKEIILRSFSDNIVGNDGNPLDELTPSQRQLLLNFIETREREGVGWKSRLFEDWLNDRPSGDVQFIRDLYGLGWLNRVKPVHWQEYLSGERITRETLEIGDTIEVSNGLWEWVSSRDTDNLEWFPCEVIAVNEDDNGSCCLIRFETGEELEIQGIYRWNRTNWRFPVD